MELICIEIKKETDFPSCCYIHTSIVLHKLKGHTVTPKLLEQQYCLAGCLQVPASEQKSITFVYCVIKELKQQIPFILRQYWYDEMKV